MSKRRKALHGVMVQLDQEVADGHLNEGAHLRLCNRLKRAFDATSGKRKHIESYLLETLEEDPIATMSVPIKYRTIIECPMFLTALFERKRAACKDGKIPTIWWEDLLAGIVTEWLFDNLEDREFLSHARGVVGILLATDNEVLPHLEKHLDKIGMKPSLLFALKPIADYEEGWPDVTHALNADARFIRWLLKDDGYSEEDKAQLLEWAFEYADKDAHLDDSWLEAMGLRNIVEVMSCLVSHTLGKTFAQAREMIYAKRVDQPAQESNELTSAP